MTDTDTATKKKSERAALFSDMPEALQEVAKDLETKFGKKARMLCISAYDMGTKIRHVIEEEAQYGSNAVEQLAVYLGKKANDLYNLRNFASSFTRKFVEEMTSEPMGNGEFVTRYHFYTMMTVTDCRTAKKLWKKVMKLGWSSVDLHKEISAMTGNKAVRRGGSTPKHPVSAAAGLESIRMNAQKVRNLIPVICEASCDKIDEMPPSDIDEKLLGSLVAAQAMVVDLRSSSELLIERLEDNIERAERVLAAKKSLTGDEDSDDDEEESEDEEDAEELEDDEEDETVGEVEGEEDSDEDDEEVFKEFAEEREEGAAA